MFVYRKRWVFFFHLFQMHRQLFMKSTHCLFDQLLIFRSDYLLIAMSKAKWILWLYLGIYHWILINKFHLTYKTAIINRLSPKIKTTFTLTNYFSYHISLEFVYKNKFYSNYLFALITVAEIWIVKTMMMMNNIFVL